MLLEERLEDTLSPKIQDIDGKPFFLAFDTEARLANFCPCVAQYVAINGRVLAEVLSGQEVGLALNLNVAGSEILLPFFAMNWLSEVIAKSPEVYHALPKVFFTIDQKAEGILVALSQKLAPSSLLAKDFLLTGVEYDDKSRGILLAIIEAAESTQKVFVKAAHEAILFSVLNKSTSTFLFFGR